MGDDAFHSAREPAAPAIVSPNASGKRAAPPAACTGPLLKRSDFTHEWRERHVSVLPAHGDADALLTWRAATANGWLTLDASCTASIVRSRLVGKQLVLRTAKRTLHFRVPSGTSTSLDEWHAAISGVLLAGPAAPPPSGSTSQKEPQVRATPPGQSGAKCICALSGGAAGELAPIGAFGDDARDATGETASERTLEMIAEPPSPPAAARAPEATIYDLVTTIAPPTPPETPQTASSRLAAAISR